MITGEWITLVVAIGAGIMLISAIGNYWASGAIGLKLLVIELLLTGAVAASCFYFMPNYDKGVLEKRYRKTVIQEVWKCQEQCARTCLKVKDIGERK